MSEIKTVDRRGVDDGRWSEPQTEEPKAAQQATTPEETQAVIAYAERSAVQTTIFLWRCPACNVEAKVAHMLQPKEVEAVAAGAYIEYDCKCGSHNRVIEKKTSAVLPGLPNNRHGRRAAASILGV